VFFSLKNAINTVFCNIQHFERFKFQLNPYVRVDRRNLNVAKSGEESQELMPDFAARNELVVLDN
jgi:hypothetical protein